MNNLINGSAKDFIKRQIKSKLPPNLQSLRLKIRLTNQADLYRERARDKWLRALKFILSELSGNDIYFRSPDGISYISMPNNYSSFVTCVVGARDPEIWRFIRKTLKPGSVFVDAGANIGTYTLPASKLVGAGGRVLSFEAHPKTFAYLKRNLENNRVANATALNLALGDKRGFISIKFDSNNPGETHVSDEKEGTVGVELTTVDFMLGSLGIDEIHYLKIDVEGFELPVIRGAKNTLFNSRNIIIQTELEEKHAARYGHRVSEVCDLLQSLGFVSYKIDNNGDAQRLETNVSGDVIWMRSSVSTAQFC
ncbi:hypothetical protein GOFOIKOB_6484 [Methylobacterium tardum]|uniref:Methyltransferase FkbM domain-containing protein n=1 Tax=Methylobacterium tardum TaxID=374432 RepID=A0AA37WQP9_9HYPH|nr:FkbM family methyltransferase [Methylobacterium tardum]URD37887.1 FkbM family methyltransferase [Methylobacterium tardum]GJE53405.1 hypothetical protein GOFOIKOB_6484 [Methylobacterium tardum]GLS68097.1 hypothetical protein GCM10007890_01080 [Methylobacterium tardum]